jgi:hypothetical protein
VVVDAHEDSTAADAQEHADSIVADSTGADTGDEDSTAAEGRHEDVEQAGSGPSPSVLVPSPCPVRVGCGLAPFPSPAHGTHAAPVPFAAGAHDHDPSRVAADVKAPPSPGVPDALSPCLVHGHAGEAESLAVESGIAALVHARVAPDLCPTIRVLCPCLAIRVLCLAIRVLCQAIRVPCPTTRVLCRARVLCQAHVPCQTAPAPVYLVPFAAAQYAPSLVHEHASQEDLDGDGVAVGGVKAKEAVVDEPCA